MFIDLERDRKVFELLKQVNLLTDAPYGIICEGHNEQWFYNPERNSGTYMYLDKNDELTIYHMKDIE